MKATKFLSLKISPSRVALILATMFSLLVLGIMILTISGYRYRGWPHPPSWRLQRGMSMEEVSAIVGEPDVVVADGPDGEWFYRGETIWIGFQDNELRYVHTNIPKHRHPANE
jgi:hypothetical protein